MVQYRAVRKRWAFAVVVIAFAGYDVLVRSVPARLQPYLPGVIDKRSWLQTNCRGAWRDIEKCKATIQALEGAGADALKLALTIPAEDLSGRLHWLQISAQNGSVEGMRRLGVALAELSDATYARAHHLRARFWLRRAMDGGDTEAPGLLQQLSPEPAAPIGVSAITEAYLSESPRLICSPLAWWRVYELIVGDFDAWTSFNGSPVLPCNRIAAVEADVLSGGLNMDDQSPLMLFFSIPYTASPSRILHETYWGTIAAENGLAYGNTQAISSLGAALVAEFSSGRSSNPDYKMRGRFWLRMAAVGDSEYSEVLRGIQDEDLASPWLVNEH